MTKNSTDYYRENKLNRSVVYRCEQCNFETTYGKCVLTNHINAHHTIEANKPYQCKECKRGFAQKAHLISHLDKVHDTTDPRLERKNGSILYFISPTTKETKSYKTKARRDYYLQNPMLKSKDIHSGNHIYHDNCVLKNHDIHYDEKNGFIVMNKVQLKEPLKIPILVR
tara:strand:+ start:1366 stop:1872 length:507 start_codon:yes stop_codon:yes gene_type:complete